LYTLLPPGLVDISDSRAISNSTPTLYPPGSPGPMIISFANPQEAIPEFEPVTAELANPTLESAKLLDS
jgi:hypothetical protein